MNKVMVMALAALGVAGCASWGYRWTSDVPENMRTVAIPNFENRTADSELGTLIAQYAAREFQREGTFKLRRQGDAAVEIQGAVTSSSYAGITYDRNYSNRAHDYRYIVEVTFSVIDKRRGKTLIENRVIKGEDYFVITGGDLLTGKRNAAFRVAADVARQLTDIVTTIPYSE